MWLLVAFAGGVGIYCNPQMSKEERRREKKNFFFSDKTVTKQGLIVLRWIFPESFSMLVFQKNWQEMAVSTHSSLSADNSVQTFSHDASWDFMEWFLHVTHVNMRQNPEVKWSCCCTVKLQQEGNSCLWGCLLWSPLFFFLLLSYYEEILASKI